jgi:copper chaperone CopZ
MIRVLKFGFVCAAVLFLSGCTSEVTLSVPDMMCEESCAVKVREVLSKQEGVQSVKVDFPSRTATLAVRGSSFSTDQAIAALVDHGFEEARLKTGDSPALPETKAVEIETQLPVPPAAIPTNEAPH